jgi:sterol desaturase/sphingolipid hydroxylase (fatty acid hydroxylase superfamily)
LLKSSAILLKSSGILLKSYLTWLASLSSGGAAIFLLFMFFFFLAILEFYCPREKLPTKSLRQSYKTNTQLFVFNSILMSLLSIPSLFIFAERYAGGGLLNYISNPLWKAALSFLAIDLLLYLWHKASHSFDCFWMFHKVHHNDPYLNVSTAFRIHFLEVTIITSLKAMLAIALGIKGPVFFASEVIITLFTLLHHSNISFRGEHFLGRVFITPYLHRVHHSVQRNEHDRNYGAVLSIWDHLFGTSAALNPSEIGVKGSSPQDLLNLLKYGITMPESQSAQTANLDLMISEAAYYKAEKRGFSPNNELRDWLEAKREIIGLVYGEKQVRNNIKQKLLNFAGAMGGTLHLRNKKYQLD